MNKVFNINLGGIPFTIDEDAYLHLNNYLETIHNHFRQSEGYEEITNDIEARMAELFQEKLENRPIIMLQDVKHVITIMGTPEDFGAEPMEEEVQREAAKKWKFKTGKRLFRNPEDEVIGGVCSGIAAYLGIQDPLWVRLVFGLFAITGGFAIPLYIILWIALPKAETASDRLAMRGEPANVSNIGKIIEEEFEHVSRKVNEFGEELKAEFKSKKKSTTSQDDEDFDEVFGSKQFRSTATRGIHLIGSVVLALIEVIRKIIKPIAFVIGVGLVFLLALLWIVLVGGLFFGLPFSSFLFPAMPAMTVLGVVTMLVFLGIPLLMLIMFVMRLFMRTGFTPRWTAGLWIVWAVSVVSLFFLASSSARQFSSSSTVNLGSTDNFPGIDTLFIEQMENPHDDSWLRIGDELMVSGNTLVSSNIELDIEKSKSGNFELVQKHYSRGESSSAASQLAGEVSYQPTIEGKKLMLPSYFTIEKGKRWRGQKVVLTLRVPEGKFVKIQENNGLYRIINDVQADEQFEFPIWDYSYTWQMGPNGMICQEYAEVVKTEELSFSDYNRIQVEGKVKLKIRQGPEFQLNYLTGTEFMDEVEISKSDDRLNIFTQTSSSSPITIEILMPEIIDLQAYNSDDIEIRGFNLTNLSILNHGNGEIKAFLDAEELKIDLRGNNNCDIRGKGNVLTAFLNENSKLDSEYFQVSVADIEVRNDSYAKISVADTLRQSIDENSKVKPYRTPKVVINK